MTKAERAAIRLLEEHRVEYPPTPVSRVVRDLGIRLAYESLEEEISGVLYRNDEDTVILINRNNPPVRQRFSIAHELGHYCLHQGEIFIDKRVRINFRDRESSLAYKEDEIQANAFAAAFLMPREWVFKEVNRRRMRQRPPADEELILELAKAFRVSQEAIQFRLANLGLLGTF